MQMIAKHGFPCTWADSAGADNESFSCEELNQMLSMLENHSASKSADDEYTRRLSYYLMGIGGSVICCLGIIANALSVAVLTRRSMRSSTYAYLTALAVCDSLVLFFTFLLVLNDTKHPEEHKEIDQLHAHLFPFVHPTAVVFQVTSIWLTLAFTVDRYIMICHPFKAEVMCRRSRARKVIIFLYIAGLIFNIPRYLEYRTKVETLPISNSSEVYNFYLIEPTALGKNVLFIELVHSWLYLIFICGVPFFTLVILNAFLIRAVHLSRLKGKEINPTEKHRNDTTIMLIGVIIIFLICQGPALVSRMVYAFNPSAAVSTNPGYILNEVGNFFVYLNSAINIVPYYLFGRKFRSEFWRLFCKCFFDKDELRRIVKSYSVSVDQRRLSQYNVMEMNGVFQSSPNFSSMARKEGKHNQRPKNFYGGQRKRKAMNGGGGMMRHSDTTDSVAAPLIHSTQNSLSSSELNRDMSQDSIKNISSLFGLSGVSPQYSNQSANGHVHYMTITDGPSISSPEWSTV